MCPIYDYQCPKCDAECGELRKMDDRENGPVCYRNTEHGKMTLVISPTQINVKNPAAGPSRS